MFFLSCIIEEKGYIYTFFGLHELVAVNRQTFTAECAQKFIVWHVRKLELREIYIKEMYGTVCPILFLPYHNVL